MTHRLIVLALLSIVGSAQSAEATNDTIATALQAMLGEKRSQTLASLGVGYFGYELYAQRSYVAFCWPASYEAQVVYYERCSVEIRDSYGNTVGTSINGEPFPKAGAASAFTPYSSTAHFVRIRNEANTSQIVHLIVMETTLASPWYFINESEYDSFVEIRNHTAQTLSATVRAYGTAGALAGSTTVSLQANGNTFVRVKADLSVPPPGSGSVTITHNGMPGAIVANVTTLSPQTGLSFDAPFTPRMVWSMF